MNYLFIKSVHCYISNDKYVISMILKDGEITEAFEIELEDFMDKFNVSHVVGGSLLI